MIGTVDVEWEIPVEAVILIGLWVYITLLALNYRNILYRSAGWNQRWAMRYFGWWRRRLPGPMYRFLFSIAEEHERRYYTSGVVASMRILYAVLSVLGGMIAVVSLLTLVNHAWASVIGEYAGPMVIVAVLAILAALTYGQVRAWRG